MRGQADRRRGDVRRRREGVGREGLGRGVLVGEAGERRLARRAHDDDGDEQGRQDEPLAHEAPLSRAGG